MPFSILGNINPLGSLETFDLPCCSSQLYISIAYIINRNHFLAMCIYSCFIAAIIQLMMHVFYKDLKYLQYLAIDYFMIEY